MSASNAKNKLSLDELFTIQSRPTSLVTIEQIENSDRVKITPWASNRGCLCSFAFEVTKDAIEYVLPTGDIHPCCGKNLHVVAAYFKEGRSVPVTDIVAQIIRSVATSHEHHNNTSFPPPQPRYGRPVQAPQVQDFWCCQLADGTKRTVQGNYGSALNCCQAGGGQFIMPGRCEALPDAADTLRGVPVTRPLSAPRHTGPHESQQSGSRGVTCICDHFINRFCGSDGMIYETYWCYDDTGAYCGSETVPTGVSCTGASSARGVRGGSVGAGTNCGDPVRQCDWGCCPPGQLTCYSPARGCYCCSSMAACLNGLC